MTKKEIKERNARLSIEMQRDPERYIKAHEAIEVLMNLSGLIDNAVQTLDEIAPFILYGKAHAYKDLQKALDGCVEYARKMLNNDDMYMDCVKDNMRLYDIIHAVLRMADTQKGWLQLDSVARTYIERPEYTNRYRNRLIKKGIEYWRLEGSPLEYLWEQMLKK